MFSIRKGPWKLILGQGSVGWSKTLEIEDSNKVPIGQLYNIIEDQKEKINLYKQYSDMVAELT